MWCSLSFADTIPIIQADVKIKQMSDTLAYKLFSGDYKKWPDGSRVKIIIQDPHSLSIKLFMKSLSMPASAFASRIGTNINDGADIKIVDSSAQVLIEVSNTPGAAGIYSGTLITNKAQELSITK